MVTGNYQLTTVGNKLVFKTSSFKAERTSVLHSGVYSKEFSSMLLASAAALAAYILTDSRPPLLRYTILIIIFALSFIGANKFIFKDKELQVVFDRKDRTAHIIQSGLFIKKRENIPFADIKSVIVGNRQFNPDNIDGINFVQKISAQHGSAVPGLGESEEFITLSLLLTDNSERIIYAARLEAGKIDGEPEIPVREIREFLRS
ncbi:MAG: hypothetical protein C4581_09840 [Nitrospiraceae bacterium]|nr:MAG: hypothetical protein C4581_09840 [Nitrospiraceae bacterium]